MTAPFTNSGHVHYAEAMRHAGPEALARLAVADRIVDAEREALIVAATQRRPRTRPVIASLGAALIRLGERLESPAAPQHQREYA
jgi:hypothetical protein